MGWIAVMRYVGGYTDYLALQADARAYEDVLLAMAGEADAAKILDMERQMKAGARDGY